MNLTLHDYTRDLIAKWLDATVNPCVGCSFGKDSMVMLHFIREQRPDIPVVYFRRLEQGSKHAFAERMVREWNLNISYPPFRYRDLYGKLGHVEILDVFEVAPGRFIVAPLEPQSALELDQPFACGMDLLQEPVIPWTSDFDAIFIGQRMDDKDIIMGDNLIDEEVKRSGDFQYLFPLAKWTSKDVWDAVRRYEIPVNGARYVDHKLEANNDLWNLCTQCLSTDRLVVCPKDQTVLPGAAGFLNLQERTRDICDVTLNLKGRT